MDDREREASFSIGTYDQRLVEENAEDTFGPRHGDPEDRRKAMRAGYVDAQGKITEKGWDVLNDDISKLERNSLAWLREKFKVVRDEGHDQHDDLVGSLWFDLGDETQVGLIELGVHERIDMVDTSYGDLGNSVWKGTSPFSSVLGGAINFTLDQQTEDEVEEAVQRALSKKKRRR